MKYDRAYEVVDSRRVEPTKRMGLVGRILPYAGGLEIQTTGRRGIDVTDDMGFEDDSASDMVMITTPLGRVTLTLLTLERYHDTIEPFLGKQLSNPTTEAELHEQMIALIKRD